MPVGSRPTRNALVCRRGRHVRLIRTMSADANSPSGHSLGLSQFDVAESGAAGASPTATSGVTTCKACSRPIASAYYEVNSAIICASCRAALDRPPGSRFSRGLHATGLGLLAAIAGSLLYFAVAAITGREFGLVAIAVGFMVGKAVRKGSRGRGGWAYQTLAIGLTYLAIVSTYIPLIAKDFQKGARAAKDSVHVRAQTPMADTITISARGPDVGRALDSAATTRRSDSGFSVAQAGSPTATTRATPVRPKHLGPGTMLLGVGALVLLAAMIPIFAGFSNIIGLIIIGIAVFEAWKLNRRVALPVTGPYRVDDGARAPVPLAERIGARFGLECLHSLPCSLQQSRRMGSLHRASWAVFTMRPPARADVRAVGYYVRTRRSALSPCRALSCADLGAPASDQE